MFALATISFGQVLLARWTFPSGTNTDSIADGGITANSTKVIKALGGVSAINFSTNGLTNKSAQATQWDNGNGTKYWQIEFSTKEYNTLTLSAIVRSGGNNPGPKDYKTQYKVGKLGTWTDVPSGAVVAGNDWTTGVQTNLSLPSNCNDKDTVFIRWIMTSNLDYTGTTDVLSTGISKMDNIYIYGQLITNVKELSNCKINIYPIPAQKLINIDSKENISEIQIYNLLGEVILKMQNLEKNQKVDVSNFNKGIYFVKFISENNETIIKKIVVE